MMCSSRYRPRSIYQYSNLVPRLSGQTSIFGVVSFVSKSLLGIEGQKNHEKFASLIWRSQAVPDEILEIIPWRSQAVPDEILEIIIVNPKRTVSFSKFSLSLIWPESLGPMPCQNIDTSNVAYWRKLRLPAIRSKCTLNDTEKIWNKFVYKAFETEELKLSDWADKNVWKREIMKTNMKK